MSQGSAASAPEVKYTTEGVEISSYRFKSILQIIDTSAPVADETLPLEVAMDSISQERWRKSNSFIRKRFSALLERLDERS